MTAREMSQLRQVSQISTSGTPLAYSTPAGNNLLELLRAAEAAQAEGTGGSAF